MLVILLGLMVQPLAHYTPGPLLDLLIDLPKVQTIVSCSGVSSVLSLTHSAQLTHHLFRAVSFGSMLHCSQPQRLPLSL
jgi:hypothetical protein